MARRLSDITNPVRGECLLPVGGPLHSPENLLEIPAHSPGARPRRFCQSHPLEYGEARGLVSRANACRLTQISLYRIANDREVMWPQVQADIARVSQETAVDRRESLFRDFAPLGFDRIKFRTIPELARAEIFHNAPNPMLYVIPAQTQRTHRRF